MRRAHATPLPAGGPAERSGQLSDRCGVFNGGQGIQVPVVDSLGDLGAAGQVGDALAHEPPARATVLVAFGGAIDLENGRVVG